MDDICLIAQCLGENSFAHALIRHALDMSSPRSNQEILYSIRWHFLLGSIPSSHVSLDNFESVCDAALSDMLSRWRLVEAKTSVDEKETTGLQHQQQRAAPKRRKFDSSSDDDDDDDNNGGETEVNPLRPHMDSSYALMFKMGKLRSDILKDVSRLYWDLPIFELAETRADLECILLNYCIAEDREYKQGLHEIVAFLYYIVHRDASMLSSSAVKEAELSEAETTVRSVCIRLSDESVRTAVVFALLTHIMREEHDGMGLGTWYYCANGGDEQHSQSGVVVAAETIQGDLLYRIDPELHHRIDSEYDIHSFTYLVRWLRLLFLREFSFTQGAIIWSVIFSEVCLCRMRRERNSIEPPYSLQTSFIVYFSVSMLTYVKEDLMTDNMSALRRLMHYPPVEDIRSLVLHAVNASSSLDLKDFVTGFKEPEPEPESERVLADLQEEPLMPRASPSLSSSAVLEDDAAVMARQGRSLTSIIQRLEQKWFPSAGQTAEEEEALTDEYIQAIAELKKVRDVLLREVEE